MFFDPRQAADGVWVGIAFIAMVAAFQYIFVPTMTDCFRDRLFAVRRELFLLAATGRIAPSDPAYVSLRRTLNGFIRFAGRLTFVRGFIGPAVALTLRKSDGPRQHRMKHEQKLAAVTDDATRAELMNLHERIAKASFIHVVASSPTAWACTAGLLPVAILVAVIAGTIETLKSTIVSEVSARAECDVEALLATA